MHSDIKVIKFTSIKISCLVCRKDTDISETEINQCSYDFAICMNINVYAKPNCITSKNKVKFN